MGFCAFSGEYVISYSNCALDYFGSKLSFQVDFLLSTDGIFAYIMYYVEFRVKPETL